MQHSSFPVSSPSLFLSLSLSLYVAFSLVVSPFCFYLICYFPCFSFPFTFPYSSCSFYVWFAVFIFICFSYYRSSCSSSFSCCFLVLHLFCPPIRSFSLPCSLFLCVRRVGRAKRKPSENPTSAMDHPIFAAAKQRARPANSCARGVLPCDKTRGQDQPPNLLG